MPTFVHSINETRRKKSIFVPSEGESHLHLALLRTALHVRNIVKSGQDICFPISTEHSFSSYQVLSGSKSALQKVEC